MYFAISLGTAAPPPRWVMRSAPRSMKLFTSVGLMSAQLLQKPHASVQAWSTWLPAPPINWVMRSATRFRSASDRSVKEVLGAGGWGLGADVAGLGLIFSSPACS